MFLFISYLTLISLSLIHTCDIFVGMTCTCYESIDLRCTMSKLAPLQLITPTMKQTFQSIDIKFQSDENINLNQDYFILLNNLLANTSQQSLSITLRFQNFYSFRAQTGTFRNLFKDLTNSYTRLTIELHPLRAKSILFERNTFDYLQVNELSIYADALTSSFESIFNNTNITHLNIEGAIVVHDPSLTSKFTGQIRSLKMTRMIDSVNSDEFPSFPVQSYTIEAHKMRRLDAYSFVNYTQLTGLNIIQPDVSITSRVLRGLEYLTNLRSISLDAERIADGALKYVKHIQTLTLGSYLKMLDTESINSLTSLQQLDIRYVQFSSLQANTSCTLADFINRRRMLGLTVYLPMENPECDCILVFLNNMIDNGDQLIKCQSIDNDRCVFSSCPIVSEYFTRKQRENQPVKVNNIQPSVVTPSILPPVIDFNEQDSPFYPDSKEEERRKTTIKIVMEPSIYDDFEEEVILNLTARTTILPPAPPSSSSSSSSSSSISTNPTTITTTTSATTTTTTSTTTTTTTVEITTTPFLIDPEDSDNDFSTPYMKRLQTELKSYGSANYLIVSWIPFAIIASCLFLSLVIAMIGYIIYHKRRTVSFKLVPQTAPII